MKVSKSRKVFVVANTTFMTLLVIICVVPFINLLAVSFSSSFAAADGKVGLWPVDFTTIAYAQLLKKIEFWVAFAVSIERVVIGTVLSVAVCILAAYPLSKSAQRFSGKKFYVWIFILAMFFYSGLVPMFIILKTLNMLDSIWALVLPVAVSPWNVILLLNFFKEVPQELEEYAMTEGAGHYTILFRIVLPVSLPALATILLFTIVGHWNAWFDGYVFMLNSENYPLQSYIYTVINSMKSMLMTSIRNPDDLGVIKQLNEKTLRSAQIFIAMVPIMCVYPFLQKYFVKGLVLGSVKE